MNHVTIGEIADQIGELIVDKVKKDMDEGRCRFNCRTQRESFMAGYAARAQNNDNRLAEEAYREYKQEGREEDTADARRRRKAISKTHDDSRKDDIY